MPIQPPAVDRLVQMSEADDLALVDVGDGAGDAKHFGPLKGLRVLVSSDEAKSKTPDPFVSCFVSFFRQQELRSGMQH